LKYYKHLEPVKNERAPVAEKQILSCFQRIKTVQAFKIRKAVQIKTTEKTLRFFFFTGITFDFIYASFVLLNSFEKKEL